MTIEWRDIPDYERRYSASSDGRVMSHVHRKPRERRTFPDRKGYQRVILSTDGRKTMHLVHRLIALTFLADTWFPGAVVCHTDGNKQNNAVSNLRWDTVRENNLDLIRHGRHNWQSEMGKTHCIRGHEFAGANLRISPRGRRICRACVAIRTRKSRVKAVVAI